MMKKLILIFASLATFAGCEMLGLDFMNSGSEDKENPDMTMPKDTVYLLQDEIDAFESVFVTKDGYCMGVKKDTTFAYVAAIDSINGQGTLVIYFDEVGKVRRLHGKDHTIDLSYNDDGSVNLWYQGTNGTSEIENNIRLSYSRSAYKMSTKAGDVFDPMDIATIALSLTDLKDIGEKTVLSEASNALLAADLLTTGPFSNTSTEVLTGVSSVAVAALIGGNVPIAALIAAINIANAAINDWQNAVAESYFGSAQPVTGEAVQLTDKHFVISYSITDVDPGKTDFNVGVIVADGLFITKNHNLLKKTIPYSSSNGRIIINIGDLNPKEGDKFKYRVFIESTIDNGFKWDDMMLDYWRYGAVRDLIIDEPAIRINSTEQTNAEDNNGHSYTFDFNVSASNGIPFDVDSWGVAIYETFSEKCESNDDLKESKSAEGQGTKILAFSVNVNEVMMNTDREPYTPIINHFAVPYVSFDGHTYGIFDNSVKIKLEYKEKEHPTPVDLGLSVKWASCNLGASKPKEYGGYYQWAGTTDVSDTGIYLSWSNCPYHTGSDEFSGWTKYNTRPKYGTIDNKTVLEAMDDAASVALGGNWRMPTIVEWDELLNTDNCSWTWTAIDGVKGYKVQSKKSGYTDNWIFLPAAGCRVDAEIDGGLTDVWSDGVYGSSSLDCVYPYSACHVCFNSGYFRGYYSASRYFGLSVRPVSE